MNKRKLEQKVRDLIDRAKCGHKIEDTTIELKARWPENEQVAARQLAGHANAARGEPILWVIGVDENNRTVVNVEQKELANWWPQVQNKFEGGVFPTLPLHLSFHVDGENVVALYFETDMPPYVVSNPTFGQEKGCPVRYEVPWREGNSVRTATRADLLRLLVPVTKLPLIEVRKATMTWTHHVDRQERWCLEADLYVVPKDGSPVYFPEWSAEFLYRYENRMLTLDLRPRKIVETAEGFANLNEIKCAGPMTINMSGHTTFPWQTQTFPDEIPAKICFAVAGVDNLSVPVQFILKGPEKQDNGSLSWQCGTWTHKKLRVGAF